MRAGVDLPQVLTDLYGVVVYSVAGRTQWVSPAIEDLVGWTAAELTGRKTERLWHPEDRETAVRIRDEAYGGRADVAVLRLMHADGHYVRLEVATTPHREPGGEPGALVYLRDLSGEVAAERALAEHEARYRLLAENAADIVFRSSPAGVFQWVSPSVETVLGWSAVELVGSPVSEICHPDDLHRFHDATTAVASGGSSTYEARYRRTDGSYVWLSVSARAMLGPDGTVVARVGGARLIQAEVEAREARARSETMLQAAIEAAAIGMAIVRLDGTYRHVNPALCAMLQRSAEWLLAHRHLEMMHPEDRGFFELDIEAMIAGEGDVRVRELRMLRADGSVMWARRAGMLIRDPSGEAQFVLVQIEDVTAQHEAQLQLSWQAFHDSLTGLRNRAWMLETLDAELEAARESQEPVGVLFVDLDNFKLVNDSLSHDAGDEVLTVVAGRIARALGPRDHIGRFGGDKFVVVTANAATPAQLERLAARLGAAVEQDLVVDGHRLVPTISVGIVVSRPGSTAAGLLRDADAALYRSKRGGRARWHFFDEAMHVEAVQRLTLEEEIRRAVPAGELVVHYQPVVELPAGRVVGHEALVRWQHPTRGLLPPSEFLPVAEDSGLVLGIGDAVLEQACSLLAARPDVLQTVAVNVSAVQLRRPDALRSVSEALARHALDPHRLVLEVTETAVLSIGDDVLEELVRLRATGVGIHVDDFGTGFSSIALLRDLPVSGMKLDMRFVHELTAEPSSANALAAGLASLANALGLTGIAEGIETPEQAEQLAQLGWQLGQGYLFGKPAPIVAGRARPRR